MKYNTQLVWSERCGSNVVPGVITPLLVDHYQQNSVHLWLTPKLIVHYVLLYIVINTMGSGDTERSNPVVIRPEPIMPA